ncbi:aconitase family protein, partial [Kibdelosporangium lantanae]
VTVDGNTFELDHGAVAIAAITSCTNTSNPSVMIGAALLAKKAVERGLERKPWVKTTLAPGSKVVMDYYERAGLLPYLEKLGFHLVGYGCTTCIGNSGPLQDEISQAAQDQDLALVSVLSGNRNFEGRINPDIKMNYLASPPLVVAYALAGSMDLDIVKEPLGTGSDGTPVYLADIWPSPQEVQEVVSASISSEMFTNDYADVFKGDERWQSLPTPTGNTFEWAEDSTYVRKPPYFEGMANEPSVRNLYSSITFAKTVGASATHCFCMAVNQSPRASGVTAGPVWTNDVTSCATQRNESYPVVRRILSATKVADIRELIGSPVLKSLQPKDFVDDNVGLPTVTDILSELDKPGRDPRPAFKTAAFADGVEKIGDLKPGMTLEGVVTNVAAFGAFVDIGVHQDGLVHVSAMSRNFVKDPRDVVKPGDIVRVKVLDVDIPRKRIGLTLRLEDEPG